MKNIVLVLSIALVFTLGSCSEDSAVSSNAKASFEMRAVSGTSTSGAARGDASEYTYTSVLAGVTEIELETLEENFEEEENGEDEDEEVEFEGAFIIDLLTGTSDPDFGLSALLPGVYEEVEIEFENILPGNKTIIVNFNFVAEGAIDPTFVEFSTAEEFELEIENEAGFVLDQNAVSSILVTLNLDLLISSIDFSGLSADEDGVIRINESSNVATMEAIVDSLEEAMDAEEQDEDDEEEEEEESDDD